MAKNKKTKARPTSSRVLLAGARPKAFESANIVLIDILKDVELDFMYESKSSEYVFGAEVGDGFITLSVPKDRFGKEPTSLIVSAKVPS